MKHKINHHTSSAIIFNQEMNRFLFGMYDNTYPFEKFRNAINFIGGNYSYKHKDISPLATLKREISEEFSCINSDKEYDSLFNKLIKNVPKFEQTARRFASEKDMKLIRKNIISGIVPFNDILAKNLDMGNNNFIDVIFSVYLSRISDKVFDIIHKNINDGKSLTNEGLLKIVSLEELKKGSVPRAWAAQGILSIFFIREGIYTEDYNIGSIQSINGKPRNSYRDYLKDFDYQEPIFIA